MECEGGSKEVSCRGPAVVCPPGRAWGALREGSLCLLGGPRRNCFLVSQRHNLKAEAFTSS